MTTYQIGAPDGNTYKVDGPTGASDAEVRAEVLRQHPEAGSAKPGKPAAKPAKQGALASLGIAAARPIARVAEGVARMVPDAAIEGYNAVTGRRVPETGEAINKWIDKYLPESPTSFGRGIEGLNEFVVGAMTPGGVASDAEAAAQRAVDGAKATYRAAQYVEKNLGVAWQKVPKELQGHLARIASNPKDLAKLDPALVAKEMTSGGRTSELVQGDLTALLTKAAPKSETKTPGQVGASVQGALRSQLKGVRANIDKLYAAAREKGEDAAPANVDDLVKWASVPANKRGAPWLQGALADYAKGPAGKRVITVNDLERVRAEANAQIFDKTGPGAHYAGEAKKMIDSILDRSGGPLYKAARQAQSAYKQEWVRQGVLRKLTTDVAKTDDPRVALENTVQSTVIRGSAADLTKVKQTLLAPGLSKEVGARGAQAWNDLQAGAINYLKEVAQGTDAGQFSNRFLNRLTDLDRDGKLTTLFGEDLAGQIRATAQTVRNVRGLAKDADDEARLSAGKVVRLMQYGLRFAPVAGYVAGHWPGLVAGHAVEYVGKAALGGERELFPKAVAKAAPGAVSRTLRKVGETVGEATRRKRLAKGSAAVALTSSE